MKHINYLFVLLLLIITVGCRAQTTSDETGAPEPSAVITKGPQGDASATPVVPQVPTRPTETATPVVAEPTDAEEPTEAPPANLPLLPSLQQISGGPGIGEPLPGGAEDPFAQATFSMASPLPDEGETAVVELHRLGQLDEAQARALADRFGFTGPLYVQRIPPEFAPPPGEESPILYTAFAGQSILTISANGLTYEDRAVTIDYDNLPSLTTVAQALETQLNRWGVLDFPFELRESPTGEVSVHRLIDGVAAEQSEFNVAISQAGEINIFSYQPLRQITTLGHYPLQTAEMAWQQLQIPDGRTHSRYELWQPVSSENDPFADFVNPRSWKPLSEAGQERHLYISPIIYEATDGSGLRIIFDEFTLTGTEEQTAAIAAHLSDGLHVWGHVALLDGTITLEIAGWEKKNVIQYETLEGTISYEAGEAILTTTDDERFILSAAPKDIPDGIVGYVNVAARRKTSDAYPVLDWLNITEKINWPDVPLTPPEAEPADITAVTMDSASLIYYTLHQTVDGPETNSTMLYLPVWKFTGTTDLGQSVIFWVSAVAPEYWQTPPATAVPPTGMGSPPPAEIPAFSENAFHTILGQVSVPSGWHVAACEGQAAFLCISNEQELVGFAEFSMYPLAQQTGLMDLLADYGLVPGAIDTESQAYREAAVPVLKAFAADHLASTEADRLLTFGDSWRFVPLATEAIRFGDLPGLAYGFTSLDQEGNIQERYVTYVAFDDKVLYLVGANSDPAATPHFTNDADLVQFAPHLQQIVAGLHIPPPESNEAWREIGGSYVTFAVPSSWQPTPQRLSGGAILEEWHLGIPDLESDQSLGFTAVALDALQPNDIVSTTEIVIGGQPGIKWVRSGDNYVSYDYHTAAPKGQGSFGLHVTVSSPNRELESTLDQIVRSIQFNE